MKETNKDVWFPAKRYGWGWGLPCCWQGWAVMGLWMIVVAAGAIAIGPRTGMMYAFTVVMIGILITICWIKGEKPRWRWGKD